jgi:hypothetical protein
MRTVSQQIGWSQEAKLLYEIQRELDRVYNATWIAAGNTTTNTTTIFVCTDADIVIGTQTWKVCNLDVTTYRNGDPIPEVTDPTEWLNLTTGAWCWYENDSANGAIYGRLYNAYAINDPRGIGPIGYHIPTKTEWETLVTTLGGQSIAGGKLKTIGTQFWNYPNEGATNESGFSALGGGYRIQSFVGFNTREVFWTSTPVDELFNYWFFLFNETADAIIGNAAYMQYGLAVRLIKD